jgi:hypothetical protein
VERGIVAAINGIAAVYVGGDYESRRLGSTERVRLVRGGVGTQDGVFVDIICIRLASPWMVQREAKGVEILVYGDDGREVAVIFVDRLRELPFNKGAGDRQRVGRDQVEFAR